MAKGRKVVPVHLDEDKKPGCVVFSILGNGEPEVNTTFGKLKVGAKFRFVRTESSPKDASCPLFEKVFCTWRVKLTPTSGLHNYILPETNFKGWIHDLTPVIEVI